MDELSRQIGKAEATFEANPDNIQAGLKLANLLLQRPDTIDQFNQLAASMLDKFSDNFKLQNLLYHVSKARNEKEKMDIAAEKAMSVFVDNVEDLRNKILIFRDRDDKDGAVKSILEFESKFGRSPDTCWLLIDTYLAADKKDEAEKVCKDLEAMPESYMKLIVLASALISLYDDKLHQNWEKSQDMMIDALKMEPKNALTYRVLLASCKNLAPNRKTLDTFLNAALEYITEEVYVFLNLLGVYIEYSIVIRNRKLFEKLREMLPELEHPVINILEALTQYFDNYGLSRSIVATWFDVNETSRPEFSIFISNFATNLAKEAKNGVGLKTRSIDEKQNNRMSNDDLSKFLQNTAIQALQRYMQFTQDNPDAYYRLGLLYASIEDERAYMTFMKALEMQPDNVNVMYQIAIIKDNQDDDIEAYEMFRRIAASKSTEMGMMIDAMIRASEIAIKYGWIDEGEDFLERANALMPTNPQVITLLGKVFLKEAKIIGSDFALAKAYENFLKALALDPMNMDAAYYLGQVFYIKREYLAAIRQFNETSQKFKQCSMLCSFWTSRSYHQLYKGLLFSSKDFLTSAIKHAESLKVLSEKIPETQEYIAELYLEAGMENESKDLLETTEKAKKAIAQEFIPKPGQIGEVKVLAVYAPQVTRADDPNRVDRVFSKGSVSHIEVSYLPGNGGLLITGNMGESFQNAIEVAFAFFKRYLMSKNRIQDPQFDIHVDIPGWFPKFDGPSAGVNLACSMVSAYSGKAIPENVTMTGEISFHGNVMPVGGIKEKIEATYDKGVDKIFIPKENQWDYLDMLIKDTGQEIAQEKIIQKLPIVKSVTKIEEIIEELGIGVDYLECEEEKTEEKIKEDKPKESKKSK